MTKEFVMRCFADCNIPHPLDLLRLGGSSNWNILGEKIIEYRTHLDKNRICLADLIIRLYLSSSSLRCPHWRSPSDSREEGGAVSYVHATLLPSLQRGVQRRRVSTSRGLGGRSLIPSLPNVPHASHSLLWRWVPSYRVWNRRMSWVQDAGTRISLVLLLSQWRKGVSSVLHAEPLVL